MNRLGVLIVNSHGVLLAQEGLTRAGIRFYFQELVAVAGSGAGSGTGTVAVNRVHVLDATRQEDPLKYQMTSNIGIYLRVLSQVVTEK